MTYALIVAETNPLHYGHTYLIQRARVDGHAVVVLMSGSFTQRGLPVVTDKFTRAKDLIEQGVHVVITHPIQSATSSGELFSYGAMTVATRLPAIDAIYCGTEFGDEETFQAIYAYELTDCFQSRLQDAMRRGLSYASAYKEALALEDVHWTGIFQSNALLAYGYFKSLRQLSSSIPIVFIPRAQDENDRILSASTIRSMVDRDRSDVKSYCAGSLPQYKESNLCESLFRLYRSDAVNASIDLTRYDGHEVGLDRRIDSCLREATTFTEFMEMAKTKRYSQWRIARLLLHGYLRMDRQVVRRSLASQKAYQVLAFSTGGTAYLREAKASSVMLLTNFKQIKKLPEEQRYLLGFEQKATDLWSVLTSTSMGRDYRGR
ncbi:MAG: nucleotidyltransferase family protein [Peptoniphilus sp.]|nr:nucleotidyltransferase family protein [Peptoniphilus sp.]MDY3119295.1 nucleotidyltransferase family protein [Peptoniphilus sp.]